MTAAWNQRFFQFKFFNRLSIKLVTIYRPNESKIDVFNGNGNNSILADGGLIYYRTRDAICYINEYYIQVEKRDLAIINVRYTCHICYINEHYIQVQKRDLAIS